MTGKNPFTVQMSSTLEAKDFYDIEPYIGDCEHDTKEAAVAEAKELCGALKEGFFVRVLSPSGAVLFLGDSDEERET